MRSAGADRHGRRGRLRRDRHDRLARSSRSSVVGQGGGHGGDSRVACESWKVPGMNESRGSDPTCCRWASRLLVSVPAGGAGKGIKKAGGPIWPTARGSSGRRSCRLRSSSRWAQISRLHGGAIGRDASPEGGASSSYRGASSLSWICARDMRAGRQSTRPRRCQPDGRRAGCRDGPSRTIGRTSADGCRVPLPALDDRETGPFEHRERAVVGVRGRDPAAARCRPGTPRGSSRHGRGRTSIAASRSAAATPWPRARRETTKQTIDQTGVSSTGARIFE